jgi:hypothetical protein
MVTNQLKMLILINLLFLSSLFVGILYFIASDGPYLLITENDEFEYRNYHDNSQLDYKRRNQLRITNSNELYNRYRTSDFEMYELSYSTLLGGINRDSIFHIYVDSIGDIYLSGITDSEDFPTVNAIQSEYMGGGDIFVTKISANGETLLFSTFLGGSNFEIISDMNIDSNGSIYLSGITNSPDFPSRNSYDNTYGGNYDIFVTKISTSDHTIQYSTFMGGSESDNINQMIVNKDGYVYLCGFTNSEDFPTDNGLDKTYGGEHYAYPRDQSDGFISKLSPDGQSLIYSSYIGGAGFNGDKVIKMILDENENVYLTGTTTSANFPIENAYQDTYGGGSTTGDGFITKISADGQKMLFNTYLGGNSDEIINDILLDSNGNVLIVGATMSQNFPLNNSFDNQLDGVFDIFITKFTNDGQSIIFSSFLGGSGSEEATNLLLDKYNDIYISGVTNSDDFPTLEPIISSISNEKDDLNRRFSDGFITKLSSNGTTLKFSTFLGGSRRDIVQKMVLDEYGQIHVTGVTASLNFPVANVNYQRDE